MIQSIPPLHDPKNLLLSLADVYGSKGSAKDAEITSARHNLFHAVGDTGPTKGPATVQEVADKMRARFAGGECRGCALVFLPFGRRGLQLRRRRVLLRSIFRSFRDYYAPLVAIPGIHDGEVYPGDPGGSLQAFQKVFCVSGFQHLPEARGLIRSSMIQSDLPRKWEMSAGERRAAQLFDEPVEGD